MKIACFFILSGLLFTVSACQHHSNKTPTVAELKASPKNGEMLGGLPLEKAKALADAASIPNRVIEVDGQIQPGTLDYRLDRLNFTVRNGIVTKVTKG